MPYKVQNVRSQGVTIKADGGDVQLAALDVREFDVLPPHARILEQRGYVRVTHFARPAPVAVEPQAEPQADDVDDDNL